MVKILFVGLILLITGIHSTLTGQSNGLSYEVIDLSNLEDFQETTENWKIGGTVFMDLYERHAVELSSGEGVLINDSAGDNPQDIFTSWEHGDLDLELQFMMAKESNSGIYFQGRYELQMLDSWGEKNPIFSDMGGVYQWSENGRGVGGIAPLTNASRAPGLWQHLEVRFRAPRFDENGEKISHAKLEEVKLNGVLIHRNVNLVHPTGGAISNEETAKGPLRFQGDHGPVAFRNIRYKMYDYSPLKLDNLTYKLYEGNFETADDVGDSRSTEEGSLEKIDLEMLSASGEFAVVYHGEIHVDQPGEYFFDVRSDGGHRVTIGNELLSERGDDARRGDSNTETITLTEGTHSFELIYFRGARGGQPAVGLMAEGPGIRMHSLHRENALPINQQRPPSLLKPEDNKPIVFHGFMRMEDKVHTHTAAVGFPSGAHFALDQNNGSLMRFWKGDFLDISTMWIGRGGGNLSLNEQAALTLSGAPSMAYLSSESEAWPDSLQNGIEYRLKGYQFDANNAPIFHYTFDHAEIKDSIIPHNDGKELKRTIYFDMNGADRNLLYRIVNGESISQLPNGLYQVNNKSFFLQLNNDSDNNAWIRDTSHGQELLIRVDDLNDHSLSYTLIW
ncbi:DUF1080 domain-containing protein [Rhodohalobacter sp. SW132]|uniref:family 16 glycoside hydrolase n=1 Tax=Rhodohalobacter sp. SW132 TaxID=2293433 RepID=UPI000E265B10|nr:family 16 glycoside hydrolase [Rhodohalobacter sp. SW132]REL37712.1 DUF1080 domain-containing protein [Rhodohalobacter sp. SW132]